MRQGPGSTRASGQAPRPGKVRAAPAPWPRAAGGQDLGPPPLPPPARRDYACGGRVGGVPIARPLDHLATLPARAFDAVEADFANRRAVARARAGHPEAFEEVVRRHARGLRALCSRILNDGPMGEDLTQEAFTRAYTSLGSFRGDGTFRQWLYSIAANGCRDFLKAGGHGERPSDLSGDELWTALDPERDAAGRQALEALSAAVSALPPGCREAFVLFHLESLSYEEMSAMTGVAVNALKVRVHRARTLLRGRLGEVLEARAPAGR